MITELPRECEFAPDRLDPGPDRGTAAGLRPFEVALLDGIVPEGGSGQGLRGRRPGHESIGGVQDALYDEVVANGWYERRPDAIRNR